MKQENSKGKREISKAVEHIAKEYEEIGKKFLKSMEPALKMSEAISSYWCKLSNLDRYLEPIKESMRSFNAISERMSETISATLEPIRRQQELIDNVLSGFAFFENITSTQTNLLSATSSCVPDAEPVKPVEIPKEKQEKLDKLLEDFDPVLKAKRDGAWTTFKSDNPDRFSQSANSAVELIVHTRRKIEQQHGDLKTYIQNKYGSGRRADDVMNICKWAESMEKSIEGIKSLLEEAKHKPGYDKEACLEALLRCADGFLLFLLCEQEN